MWLAVAVAVFSVALGAFLALWGKEHARWMAPVRYFALTASVAVVLLHLLPEAAAELGPIAGAPFVVAFVLPVVVERLATSGSTRHLGLELGFVGLLLHEVGDGVGLGTYAGPLHAGNVPVDVLVAMAAHTVPTVALVVLVYAERRSRRAAVLAAASLAAAAVVGVLSTGVVAVDTLAAWEPWIAATVSGLLLHVIFHDWRDTSAAARRAE